MTTPNEQADDEARTKLINDNLFDLIESPVQTTPSKAVREADEVKVPDLPYTGPPLFYERISSIIWGGMSKERQVIALENLITTTLAQHDEALLAKLPEKHDLTLPVTDEYFTKSDGLRMVNDLIDQITAIITGEGTA